MRKIIVFLFAFFSILHLLMLPRLALACEYLRVLICKNKVATIYGANSGYKTFSFRKFNSSEKFFSSKADKVIYVDNCPYHGQVEVVRGKHDLLVINIVPLEDYIKGVLYNEVSHYWPMEVLKAQAVVARTYALYIKRHRKDQLYDLDNTERFQVYRGINAERYRLNKAVDETKGEVLVYDHKIVPAFYHACCGGRTEYADELWNVHVPVLRSVICKFCKNCPYFNWTYSLPIIEFLQKIRKFGVYGSVLNDIVIDKFTKSGRVKILKVYTDQGSYPILAKELRLALGTSRLKSTNFKVKLIGNEVVFNGHGWGHGVGMCQWGAYNMAKQGYSYQQILEFYYPGVKIVKLDN